MTSNIIPLYNPTDERPMRVVCLMSGSGTNVRKILEHQSELESQGREIYEVVAIFSDKWDSNASAIGKDYDLPVMIRDINSFYKARDKKKWWFLKKPELDAGTRQAYDKEILKALDPYEPIDVAVYGGYMTVSSEVLVDAYLGVNVHPADLSIMDDGKRKYTGAYAVRDAILAGEKELRASTHIVRDRVDYGEILLISEPVKVEFDKDDLLRWNRFNSDDNIISFKDLRKKENKKLAREISEYYQDKLKKLGDWKIFPLTIEWLAGGRLGMKDGIVHLDNRPILNGLRIGRQKLEEFNND